MTNETAETGTPDSSDTTPSQAPVRVPNVTAGARSGLDHEIIGSDAQAAYEASQEAHDENSYQAPVGEDGDPGEDLNPETDPELVEETADTETQDDAGKPDGEADPEETVDTETQDGGEPDGQDDQQPDTTPDDSTDAGNAPA